MASSPTKKSSLRESYLVRLIMLPLIKKSGSRSIQFLQEVLLQDFDGRCVYAMSAVLKGRQMISAIVMVKITSIPKNHWRIRGH